MRWLRTLGWFIAVAGTILASAKTVMDWLGRLDFVITHRAEPGWIGGAVEYLTAPPWWLPWCVLAFGLVLIWADSRRRVAHNVAVSPTPLTKCIHPSFGEDIEGCIQRRVISSYIAHPDNYQYPPFTTVQISRGYMYTVGEEEITLYRIRVEAAEEIEDCRGRLLSISRDDNVWHVGAALAFTPAEKRSESIIIRPNLPEYLDVLSVSEKNEIRIHSYLNLPSNINLKEIFKESGGYVLKVVITAASCDTENTDLLVSWTGDAATTTVSRI